MRFLQILFLATMLWFSNSVYAVAPSNDSVADPAVELSESDTAINLEPKGKLETLKESEIPLNLDRSKKATTEGSGLFRILFTISILGILGTGAFFFLRKYKIPKSSKHQTQIKVLQQHFLGPKKSLAIVRVAGESILIGITDQNISMIKSLSLIDDEVPDESALRFDKILTSSTVDKAFDEASDDGSDEAPIPKQKSRRTLDADEEFAISGIKDIVSKRLKGMRSLQ